MFYYAVVNIKDIVQYIDSLEEAVTFADYIEIPTPDQSLVGKWYDRNGKYGEQGAFITTPISVLADYSTNQINYKTDDVWLNEKLDSYALSTDLEDYSHINHTHTAEDVGAAPAAHTHSVATLSENGFMSNSDKTKLDGIEDGANNFVHPLTHPANMITGLSDVALSGSYTDLSDKPTSMAPTAHTHSQSEISGLGNTLLNKANVDHVHAEVNSTNAGFMSSSDKSKLDGIETNANNYVHPATHSIGIIEESSTKKIMTATERSKLAGIEEGANNYVHPSTHSANMITGLSDVATTGSYDDLVDKPTIPGEYVHPATHPASMITGLSKVSTTGNYNDLSNKPTIPESYVHPATHPASMITGLSGVATSGSYTDLRDKPTIPEQYVHPATHPASMITGLSDVATSGSYADLSDKPTKMAPTAHTHSQSDITGLSSSLSSKAETNHTHSVASTSASGFMSKDDKTKLNGIATNANNYTHPATHSASMITGLSSVATSGSYNDLSNKPNIPSAYVHPTSHPASMITGLSDVATSGSYNDLSDKPTSMTPKAHTHAQSDITGLATALEGKSDTGHTHGAATTSANGFMSKEDKTKLNGIATGANKTIVDSALSSTSTNPLQNKIINTALSGKANANHNHNSSYIAKSLQMTADDGDVSVSWSNQDVIAKIKALGTGMYTAYAKGGTTNNPKSTESWRFLIHKTGATFGWVQAFGSLGSMYTGYVDSGTWKGWKCIFDADPAPLWKGAMYMSSPNSTPQTVTPSKKLSECRNGWLLLWSDYDKDTSTANDTDFVTTMIPKSNPTGGNWGGKAFYCDIPRYIGSNVSDVDTERRIIKSIYIHDNCIKGSFNNDKDERNDVVLRAVYEY